MLTVRRAALDDALRIAEVHVEGWRWGYRDFLPPHVLERQLVSKREAIWRETLADERSPLRVFIAEDGPVARGLCCVGPARGTSAAEGRGELYSLYVTEAAKGTGAGRALMDAGLAAMRADAYVEAILWVLAPNARGRAFYERCGWRPDGEAVPWHAHGVDLEEIRYRIELAA